MLKYQRKKHSGYAEKRKTMMPQAKPYKDYYTAAQVKEKLGITDGQLYNYVRYEHLERIIPPGRKQGVYKREEVDQLARELQAFMIHRKAHPTQFTRLKTREEMEKCQEISQALFGVGREIIDGTMQILERNSETFYILKDGDQIVGYTGLVPLKPGIIDKVLEQTIPVVIPLEEIEVFERGKVVDIYLVVIGVKPGFGKEEKRSYGARLISGLMKVIESLGERGVIINTIAARSNMPEGLRLMKGVGFAEIEPLTPERRTFVIEVEKSGIHFIQHYKKALEESRTTT